MYKISIEPEEIEKMPLGSFPGEIHVIEKPGLAYARAVAYLKNQKIIGFDTETRPVFNPGQHSSGVALLQLSGPEHAYLFRVKKLGLRKLLRSVLADEKILKIGAASHDDVRGLQRIAPFEEKGFVDLQQIGWKYGIKDKSVKKMAAIILGCRISKTQQLSNWEAETLTEAQQKYAATDAWVCREMYLKLMQSEEHPLTREQMMPPEQLEAIRLRAQRDAEQKALQEEAHKRAAEKKRARRRRRRQAAAKARAEERQKAAAQAADNTKSTDAKDNS